MYVILSGIQNTIQGALAVVGSAQTSLPGIPGLVGEYWGRLAIDTLAQLRSYLDSYASSRSIVILGHSLGGAIGACLIPLLQTRYPSVPIVLFSYGCRRVGDGDFSDAVTNYIVAFQNIDDPIPSIPPPLWAAAGNAFPASGPSPFAVYVSPGTLIGLDAASNVYPGGQPMSTTAASWAIVTGQVGPHTPWSYAQRLLALAPPSALTPSDSGYVDPSDLETLLFNQQGANMAEIAIPPSRATNPPLLVRFFYNYSAQPTVAGSIQRPTAGITEDVWSTAGVDYIRTTLVKNYLKYRLALAVASFNFVYARISNPSLKRIVDFVTPPQVGGQTSGYWKPPDFQFGYIGVADETALLYRFKIAGGPSGRIFLHAFDAALDNEGVFNPNSNWNTALDAFTLYLQNQQVGFIDQLVFQFADPTGPATKYPITAVAPQYPRGAIITAATAPAWAVGQTIAIGGTGLRMIGLSGRKVVTVAQTGAGLPFTVGGAAPVGTLTGNGAFCYPVNPQTGAISYAAIERLTEHRVGRPFGQARGRRKNTLALRQ